MKKIIEKYKSKLLKNKIISEIVKDVKKDKNRYIVILIMMLLGLMYLFGDENIAGFFLILFGISLSPIVYKTILKDVKLKNINIIIPVVCVFLFLILINSNEEIKNIDHESIPKVEDNVEIEKTQEKTEEPEEELPKEPEIINIEKVVFDTESINFKDNETYTIKYTITPENATERIEWISSDPTIATVNEKGEIKPLKVGKVTITAKTSMAEYSIPVNILTSKIAIKKITFKSTSATVKTGQSISLGYTVSPSDANSTITWSSKDKSIATVDQNGNVTGVKKGETTITAKSGTITAKIKVTVKYAPAPGHYGVGETAKCPDFSITLNNYSFKKKGTRIDYFTTVDDPEWIGVVVTVKNTTNYKKTIYTSDFQILNSTGEYLSHDYFSYKIWGKNIQPLNSPELAPGGKKKGYIQFSNTNKDNSNLLLIVNCNDKLIFEDTKIIFELKK